MEYTEISDLEDKIIGKGSTSYAWNKCNSGFDKGNGTRSSTTGNIYGIYDFAGCLGNYTASYINSGVKTLITNGGSFATGISNYLSTAYPYNPNPTEDYNDFNSGYNGTGWNEIFGDAIWETSGGFTPETAWFEQSLERDIGASEAFISRGGSWFSNNNSGLCAISDNIGDASGFYSFYSVLVVE